MKKLLLVFWLLPLIGFSQLTDSFSDGDFTANPAWIGNTESFIVNPSGQLQLNATAAGTAWLSSSLGSAGIAEWRFYIRESFSPSGNNLGEVYLSADAADLTSAQNGYFLRFGEAGSADAIELFKKQAGTSSSICRGTDGLVASSFGFWVRVTRSETGEWNVYTDATGTGTYLSDASGTDNSLAVGGWFGIFCQFTSSNVTKFYFDDVYAGPLVVDQERPKVSAVAVSDPFTVTVSFNEALDQSSLTNTNNYISEGELGHPQQALGSSNGVELVFGQPFTNGTNYPLTISQIRDLAGNPITDTTVYFNFYAANPNDLVINEIMTDPSPVVGLPEWEYLELFNTTNVTLDLSGWSLIIGESEKPISASQIQAGGYLLLCHEDALPELSVYGPVVGFSSFQLTNAGSSLRLVSKEGQVVSELIYADTWYQDAAKKEGGWSLEQIDPSNACGGKNNWRASVAPVGGTPGTLNSVNAPNNDAPKPARFALLNNNIIQLWFEQKMDEVSVSNTEYYTLNPGNVHPSSALLNDLEPGFVQLAFDQVFEEGTIYTLTIADQVLNCSGLAVALETSLSFGIPNLVSAGEILINEALFNPLGKGVDYVELYNNSDKIFDVSELWLGSIHQTIPNPSDTSLKIISETSYLLLPKSYLLLSSSTSMVLSQYASSDASNFLEMPSFPTYSNDKGTVLLKSRLGVVVDQFSYTETMHFPMLNSVEGVSLERISFSTPTNESTNWHSAVATAGYGTPGVPNSMQFQETMNGDEIKWVPELFSPDSDSRDDVAALVYEFDQAGYVLNVYLFDVSGNQRRHLVKSTLISASGSFFWDGLDESGNRVQSGIYVMAAEVFKPDGTVKHFKKAVVVVVQ